MTTRSLVDAIDQKLCALEEEGKRIGEAAKALTERVARQEALREETRDLFRQVAASLTRPAFPNELAAEGAEEEVLVPAEREQVHAVAPNETIRQEAEKEVRASAEEEEVRPPPAPARRARGDPSRKRKPNLPIVDLVDDAPKSQFLATFLERLAEPSNNYSKFRHVYPIPKARFETSFNAEVRTRRPQLSCGRFATARMGALVLAAAMFDRRLQTTVVAAQDWAKRYWQEDGNERAIEWVEDVLASGSAEDKYVEMATRFVNEAKQPPVQVEEAVEAVQVEEAAEPIARPREEERFERSVRQRADRSDDIRDSSDSVSAGNIRVNNEGDRFQVLWVYAGRIQYRSVRSNKPFTKNTHEFLATTRAVEA